MGFAAMSTLDVQYITNKVSELHLTQFYLGVLQIPAVIPSPLRKDNNPSFALYTNNGVNIRYIDYATKASGGLFDLLSALWGLEHIATLEKINKELPSILKHKNNQYIRKAVITHTSHTKDTELLCKVRNWEPYDIAYWNAYGISKEALDFADVYPISHKIIKKNEKSFFFKADKYAYAFAEFKEGITTLKIYQPYNTKGFKWSNKHDASVISLWTKVPTKGEKIVICSSLKDALCLWCNTKIPAIAIQGEGYNMSTAACEDLKARFNTVYILLDNDSAGIINSKKLAETTGFTNIILPNIGGAKDVSDLYKTLNNKTEFTNILNKLFYETRTEI